VTLDSAQLEALWAVARAGTFRGAAQALHVTQPAITQRIRALEEVIGQRVFVRTSRGAELTAAGQLVAEHCRRTRDGEAELTARLRGARGGLVGRLAVVSGSSDGRAWVLAVLGELAREHPHLEVALRIDDRADAGPLLERAQVDVAVGEAAVRRRGVASRRIGVTSYALVASAELARGWPDRPTTAHLRAARAIDFEEGDPTTVDLLERARPEAARAELRRCFVDDTRAILDWVLAGIGYSALPLATVEKLVAQGRLRRLFPDVTLERHVHLSVRDGDPVPAVGVFESLARTRLSSLR